MRNEARAALRIAENYDLEPIEQEIIEDNDAQTEEEGGRKFKFSSIFTKDGFGKIFSKNVVKSLVIVAAVAIIGVAVYLNWNLLSPADTPTDQPGTDTPVEVPEDDAVSYFAAAQLSRQNARDESIEVLQSIVDSESADEAAKTAALANITKISETIAMEANIENLIKSKGFAECIAVISGDGANIIVQSDGLMANELAQIMEIVYLQANILPKNVRISEYA